MANSKRVKKFKKSIAKFICSVVGHKEIGVIEQRVHAGGDK